MVEIEVSDGRNGDLLFHPTAIGAVVGSTPRK